MENLSKQQIVLLAVLVSFVTSIATGILTVSMLNKASPEVTQTINRIVERTVERVVPAAVTTPTNVVTNSEKTVVERETVVVKEDDLIPKSVEKNGASIIRIFRQDTEAGGSRNFHALGIIVRADGLVLSPTIMVSSYATYEAELSDGSKYLLNPATTSPSGFPFSLSMLMQPDGAKKQFSAATISGGSVPRLGQTIISIGGKERNIVGTGIVAAFSGSEKDNPPYSSLIETDLSGESAIPGTPLISLSGEILGVTSLRTEQGSFTSSKLIKSVFGL